MKQFLHYFLFFIWFIASACQAHPSPTQEVLALVNGRLIDGTGAAPMDNAVVLIQDGRLMEVGVVGEVAIPQKARQVDLQGATILPGFINAHVHGAYDLEKLATWAQAGVTSVRDMHTIKVPPDYALRDRANRDAKYARLVAVGNFITAPDGYPIQPWGSRAVEVEGAGEAREAVVKMLEGGADLIKIAVESGQDFGQVIPSLSDEEIAAIMAAAHEENTRVSAHVLVTKDLEQAVKGGVDDIAHMVTDGLPADLVQKIVQRGIFWEPTLELWKNVGFGREKLAIANLAKFVAAGGKVALGTDFEGYNKPFQIGMPILEMEMMQQAGMTPMDIIVAGTRNAAVVCNLEKELGTVEVGKIADLLVVRADPLLDIHALADPAWVIHNGEIIRQPR
jgi:imidazolonepropionase-like amidohydrolase